MPTLTDDKKNEIWKVYQETKSYKETAKRLDIDPRTVAKVVKEIKVKLEAKNRANSQEVKPAKPSRNQNVDPERKVQLKAYALFDRDRTNFQVSQELKLSSSEVIRYRKEYNDMKKADYDEEIEQKKEHLTRLDGLLQQRDNELQQREDRLGQLDSEVRSRKGIIAKQSSQKDRLTESIKTLKDSEKTAKNRTDIAWSKCNELERQRDKKREALLSAFIKQMDGLPDIDLFRIIEPFFYSTLFKRIMPEVVIHTVFNAIACHPNQAKIIDVMRSEDAKSESPLWGDDLLAYDDMRGLVEYVRKNTSISARWVCCLRRDSQRYPLSMS